MRMDVLSHVSRLCIKTFGCGTGLLRDSIAVELKENVPFPILGLIIPIFSIFGPLSFLFSYFLSIICHLTPWVSKISFIYCLEGGGGRN